LVSHIGPSTYSSGIDANPEPGIELDEAGNLNLYYNTIMKDAKGHVIGAQNPPGECTSFAHTVEVITDAQCVNGVLTFTKKQLQGQFVVVDL
jgi:hypothetical protein